MSFRSRPGWSKSSSISRRKIRDKKIVEVRVAIGEFTQIEEEQLRFCYESIITEMPIAGSTPDDRTGPGQSRLSALFLQRSAEILGRRFARCAGRHAAMSQTAARPPR